MPTVSWRVFYSGTCESELSGLNCRKQISKFTQYLWPLRHDRCTNACDTNQLVFLKPLTRPLFWWNSVCCSGPVTRVQAPNLLREYVLSGVTQCSGQWLCNQMQLARHPAVVKVSTFSTLHFSKKWLPNPYFSQKFNQDRHMEHKNRFGIYENMN